MAEKISRVLFSELPLPVQKKVAIILGHRKEIRLFGLPMVYTASGVALAIGAGAYGSTHSKGVAAGMILGYLAPVIPVGLILLQTHKYKYQKEELELYRVLKNSKDVRINSLFSTFPFVAINRRGDLVGKKWNPKIGFVPVGRRRIPTPKNRKVLARFLQKTRRR